MRSMTPTRRLRPVIAVLTAALFSTTAITTAVAESESPFGDAVRLADNTLDTMRGGFSGSDGGVLRFGVNLETRVNGQPIGSVSISNNAQGKISATVQNLGRTFVLRPDGSVKVTATLPSSTVSTQQNATVSVSVATPPLPTSVTVPLGNAAPPANTVSTVVVTTTLAPTLPSSVTGGATLATTGLLPNGNGVMTLIQNTRSNVAINALNTLNIQVSGLGDPALRNSAGLRSLTNSLRFSVRR